MADSPELTVEGYFAQHAAGHLAEITDELRANATELIRRWNLLLDIAAQDGVHPTVDATTKTYQASGWRPAGVNAATANAAGKSRHITAQALDVRDDPIHRPLARWLCSEAGRKTLQDIGLWCERPQWCPSWAHGQTLPPASGNRFYIPSINPPLAPPLPGEGA